MAKLYKVEMYLLDVNDAYDQDDIPATIECLFDRSELSTKCVEIKDSNEFEWDDDLSINYLSCTKEDCETYFN